MTAIPSEKCHSKGNSVLLIVSFAMILLIVSFEPIVLTAISAPSSFLFLPFLFLIGSSAAFQRLPLTEQSNPLLTDILPELPSSNYLPLSVKSVKSNPLRVC